MKVNDRDVAKVFPAKGFVRGWARILLGRTKAHKQFRSMKRLLELGIRTPESIGIRHFYPGCGKYEGALIYRFVKGVQEAGEAVKGSLRGVVFEQLSRELAVMANAGVLFVDFHLGNVMVDADGNLCWIDVEVKEGRELVRRRFWSRMERMHRKCNPGVLSEEEWESFKAGLSENLNNPEQYDPA